MTNEELVEKIQNGHAELINELLENNQGIINKVAHEFSGHKPDYIDDFKQVASERLWECIYSFEFGYDCKFSTYAIRGMRAACDRYRKENTIIHIPDHMYPKIMQYRQLKEDGCTYREIKKWMNIYNDEYMAEVIRAANVVYNMASLDAPVQSAEGSEDASLVDFIQDPSDKITDLVRELEDAEVDLFVHALPEPFKTVIYKRYIQDPRQTLDEIGEGLKITKARVRQLEKKGLKIMRREAKLRSIASNTFLSSKVRKFEKHGCTTSATEEAALSLVGEDYDGKKERWWE